MRINETTAAYFKRLASVSTPEEAKRYQDLLSPDPKVANAADEYFRANEPRHASMLRTSASPNIFTAGVGIRQYGISVDYGFSTGGGTLDATHQFGISYIEGPGIESYPCSGER